jgi:hypothetical protein
MKFLRYFLYTFPIIFYLISRFTSWQGMELCIGGLAFSAFVLSFFSAKGTYRITGVVFIVVGLYFFMILKLPWMSFFLYFQNMLGLLSIFFVLPFLSSVIRVGHYDKHLSRLLQDRVENGGPLYRRGSFIAHLLGPMLSIATIPLLVQSLRVSMRHLPDKVQSRFYTRSVLRSFALCLTWNPMEIMVITVIGMTGVSYTHIFPILFLLPITTLIIDWLLARWTYRDQDLSVDEAHKAIDRRTIYRKVMQLIGILIGLIVVVIGVQELFHQGFLLSVVLVTVPFSFLWATLIGKFRRYLLITLPNWRQRVSGLSNYIFMFVGAGFFIQMITKSGLLNHLEPLFQLAAGKPYVLYLMICVYFVFGALIGFHPIISLTLLEPLLHPIFPLVNLVSLSVVLITCSLATSMYSPYNLTVSLMSDQLGTNAYRVGSWNFLFAMGYVLLSITVACIISI